MTLSPPNNNYGQAPYIKFGEKVKNLERALRKMKVQLDQKEQQLQAAQLELDQLKGGQPQTENLDTVQTVDQSEQGPFVDPVTGREYKSASALKGAMTQRKNREQAQTSDSDHDENNVDSEQ